VTLPMISNNIPIYLNHRSVNLIPDIVRSSGWARQKINPGRLEEFNE